MNEQNNPTVVGGKPNTTDFTPVSEMALDELYLELTGLEYWGDVLEDTQPERTQARLNELSVEIERREGVQPCNS